MASSQTGISNTTAAKKAVSPNSYFDQMESLEIPVNLTYSAVYGDLKGADSGDNLVVGDVVVFVGDQLAVDVAHSPQLRNQVIDHSGIGHQGFD